MTAQEPTISGDADRAVVQSSWGSMEVTRHGTGEDMYFSAVIRKANYDPDEMWDLVGREEAP